MSDQYLSSEGVLVLPNKGVQPPAGAGTVCIYAKDGKLHTMDNVNVERILNFSVNILTYAFKSFQFIGEKGDPMVQGWTNDSTGQASVNLVADMVSGVAKEVVEIKDNFGDGLAGVSVPLILEDYNDIDEFGASFRGISRHDPALGANGFFICLQADSNENPFDGSNRRYGFVVNIDGGTGGKVKFTGVDGSTLSVLTNIDQGDWFTWEVVIPVGTVGVSSPGDLWINGVLVAAASVPFRLNTGGLGSGFFVTSGSFVGGIAITRHAEVQLVIYRESATKTLTNADFVGFKETLLTYPPGNRNYTTEFDGDIVGRSIGDKFTQIKLNVGGGITLSDLGMPKNIVFNKLNLLTVITELNEAVSLVNVVENGNDWRSIATDTSLDGTSSSGAALQLEQLAQTSTHTADFSPAIPSNNIVKILNIPTFTAILTGIYEFTISGRIIDLTVVGMDDKYFLGLFVDGVRDINVPARSIGVSPWNARDTIIRSLTAGQTVDFGFSHSRVDTSSSISDMTVICRQLPENNGDGLALSIKPKKLIGTMPNPASGALIGIPHGLDETKILGIQALVATSTGLGRVPPAHLFSGGSAQYDARVKGDNVELRGRSALSADLNGQAITIVVTYEP